MDRRRYRKYERFGRRWHRAGGDFTLREFIDDNRHDDYVLEEMVPKLRALGIGGIYVHDGGAHGVDKFKRVS